MVRRNQHVSVSHEVHRSEFSCTRIIQLRSLLLSNITVSYLRAVGRKVLWSSACVSLCVCACALCLSARYLKNGFMDHHQIWWVGPGGEPVEQVQFWC